MVIPCSLFIVIFLGISLIFLHTSIQQNKQLMNHAKSYLCIQIYHQKLHQHVSTIEKINKVLLSADLLKKVATIYPPLRLSSLGTEAVKKFLKAGQLAAVVSFQKNMFQLYQADCPIPLAGVKSPYTRAGLTIIRDSKGLAIVRKRKWKNLFIITQERIISARYFFQNKKIKITTQAIL